LIENPVVGASWEGYVIEQILFHKPSDLELYFYRTHNGAEIDLLLVDGIKPVTAIEIKLSNSPKVSRGFHSACDDIGVEQKVVITPESDGYPVSHETEVTNLRSFLDGFK